MPSCPPHPSRLIPLVYDAELDEDQRRQVAFQIADCPECTRRMQMLDHTHETLCQTLDEEVSGIDFSDFWPRVEQGMEDRGPSRAGQWASRLRLWRMQWQALFSWHMPVWATVVVLCLFGVVVFTQLPTPREAVSVPAEWKPVRLAFNNQAQIESLSATSAVLVWNEPTSNATVIWVDDTLGEELP